MLELLVAAGPDAAAVALLGWTVRTALRSRDRPSARPFVATVGLLLMWAVLAFVAEFVPASWDGLLAAFIELGQFLPALFVPGTMTVYALSYTGRGTGLTRRRVAMLAAIGVPLLVGVAVGVVTLTRTLPERFAEPIVASLLFSEIAYTFALFVYATYLLVGLGRNHARVSGVQTTLVLSAVSAPYLVGVAGNNGVVGDGVSVGLLTAGLCLGVAVRRYPVMTGFPKADYVARARVVEALREAVVVVDWDDHVIDANAAAGALFGRSPGTLVGEPLESVFEGVAGHDLSTGATGVVTLQTTDGTRRFQYTVSAVDDESGEEGATDPVARTVLFRDVTDRQTREQRLTVLNRVLRHNVRNELDVVLAHAERVGDEGLRTSIRESVTDLLALSDKAREAEDVMTAGTASPDSFDLAALARSVADSYDGERPDCAVTVTTPQTLPVTSRRDVLQYVLSELVDNACTHAADPHVSVEVTVRADANGSVEVTVADDGPGVPHRERQVLADGTETPLEHGLGVGLWCVNWAVTQLGGDLSFGDSHHEGGVVTVRLYDVADDA